MKTLICFVAIGIAVAYCGVLDESYDHDKAYGAEREYGREKQYGYDHKDKSHGYDNDDSHKRAYGSEKEYEREKKYGYESHDKSLSHGHSSYGKDKSYESKAHQGVAYSKQLTYHGKYNGHCGKDGFYYRDHGSFVICSNSNAYVQPCAPGSRNSGLDNYNYGNNYSYRDFCDINLVDHGYGVKGQYGYDRHASAGHHGNDNFRRSRGGYERTSYSSEGYGSHDSSPRGHGRNY